MSNPVDKAEALLELQAEPWSKDYIYSLLRFADKNPSYFDHIECPDHEIPHRDQAELIAQSPVLLRELITEVKRLESSLRAVGEVLFLSPGNVGQNKASKMVSDTLEGRFEDPRNAEIARVIEIQNEQARILTANQIAHQAELEESRRAHRSCVEMYSKRIGDDEDKIADLEHIVTQLREVLRKCKHLAWRGLTQVDMGVEMRRDSLEKIKALTGGLLPEVPICARCNDTHRMELEDRQVMCTACPAPCQECRQGGTGAFCTNTPCGCVCHCEDTGPRDCCEYNVLYSSVCGVCGRKGGRTK